MGGRRAKSACGSCCMEDRRETFTLDSPRMSGKWKTCACASCCVNERVEIFTHDSYGVAEMWKLCTCCLCHPKKWRTCPCGSCRIKERFSTPFFCCVMYRLHSSTPCCAVLYCTEPSEYWSVHRCSFGEYSREYARTTLAALLAVRGCLHPVLQTKATGTTEHKLKLQRSGSYLGSGR